MNRPFVIGSFGLRHSLPLVIYVAAAVAYTWPLVTHPASRLAALEGPGDPYLYVWALGWNLETITKDPTALVDGRIFEANIFHPARQTLAYSDHLIPQALFAWPIYAVTKDPVVCYNAIFFLSLVASALAMHAFIRTVVGSEPGAYAAGLAWGFWPYHFGHLAHLQLQALFLLPLTFLFLHRLVAGRRRRDAIALGALAALQAASSVYYGVIGAVGLAIAAPVLLVAVGRWRSPVDLRRLALAAIVGGVLVLPAAWPYWQVQRREGFTRNLIEASRHAARPAAYASVAPLNLVYGRTGLLRDIAGGEQTLFPGVVLVLLAGLGLAKARRHGSGPLAAALTTLIVTGFILSLGPDGIRSVYATLHRYVFGFHAIRAPARFAVLVTFGLAGLAAIGMRALARPGVGLRLVPAVVVAVMAIEYANAPIPFAPAPPARTAAGEWLRQTPEPGAVVYLPLHVDVGNSPYMVQSLEHRRPILNGYSGHRPRFFTTLLDELRGFPDADSLWTLRALDVRFLVSPRPVAVAGWPLIERAALPETLADRSASYIYELRWTPEVEARLERTEEPSPVEPGPAPFANGEVALYDVIWMGGGSTLPAGHARVTVSDPPADVVGARYRFGATGETAGWVARFFEARDVFETLADDKLRPLVHERHLREGRRRRDRVARFDHGRHLVETFAADDPSDRMTFRLAPGARDALTAFFYARSLPLAPGREFRVPLNDEGRSLVLTLRVTRVELVAYGGQTGEALRVEPEIIERVARRAAPQIVAWISNDARRIPLVVEIAAGFGRIRAVLREYRAGAILTKPPTP